MANFVKSGYGQVEPNQLSAQKTGQIYASLPLAVNVEVLQNGEFMYYDYKSGTVTATPTLGVTTSEPMLVFNEVKLYDDRLSYADFAMIRVGNNYVTSKLVGNVQDNSVAALPNTNGDGYRLDGFAPRMLKTNIGDVYTTNMVKEGVEYVAGDILAPVVNATSHTLVLEKITVAKPGINYVVAKVYTMPDGQPGLKLQRVQ